MINMLKKGQKLAFWEVLDDFVKGFVIDLLD